MGNNGQIVMILVVVVAAFFFLPKILASLKAGAGAGGFSLSNLFGGGAQTSKTSQQSTGGSGTTSVKQSNGSYDIDVSGNGCACANGVCKGNCSDMEPIDLENFDPLDWVEQNS